MYCSGGTGVLDVESICFKHKTKQQCTSNANYPHFSNSC